MQTCFLARPVDEWALGSGLRTFTARYLDSTPTLPPSWSCKGVGQRVGQRAIQRTSSEGQVFQTSTLVLFQLTREFIRQVGILQLQLFPTPFPHLSLSPARLSLEEWGRVAEQVLRRHWSLHRSTSQASNLRSPPHSLPPSVPLPAFSCSEELRGVG